MVIEGRYGVRVTRTSWATNGDDRPVVGSRSDMASLVQAQKKNDEGKLRQDEVVLYEIVPYVESRDG